MTIGGNVALSIAGGVFLGSVVALLALIAVRLLRYRRRTFPGAFDPRDFSIARYQPVMRLGGEEDFDFLASLPGYRPATGARLRRERRRILRMYLRDLAQDFRALHAAARKLVADSPAHNSELVGLLLRYQLTFWRSMFLIELRLLAPAARLPRLDLTSLLNPMEIMQIYVSEA